MDLKRDFAEYLYNRLPKIYRTYDRDQILQKLIETFAEGGFNLVIQDTMTLPELLDVDKCPKKFLPLLARSYGYEYSEELPELFQRRLLKNIVEMYKRKGTKSVVKFIARELSGFETEIIENKDFSEKDIEISGWDIRFEHYRNFILKLSAPYETSMLNAKEDAVKLVIKDFLPTNSNVFIITSYWFEESDNFSNKRIVEDIIKETIREYNEEVLKVLNFIESEVTSRMNTTDSEEYLFINTPMVHQDEVIGVLNDLVNSTLNESFYTNHVFLLDNIREYNEETFSTEKFTHSETDVVRDYTEHNFSINGISLDDKYGILLLENEYNYSDSISDSLHDKLMSSEESETKGSTGYDYVQTNVMKSTEDTLEYEGLDLQYKIEVLKEVISDERFDYSQVLGDNSVLNRPSCVLGSFLTNALFSYDKISIQGQADQIIIL